MRKILFLIVVCTVAITSFTSCNSDEYIVSEPQQISQDMELSRLYYSIDSLQNLYSTSTSRVNWDSWGRDCLSHGVDALTGLLFSESGLLAVAASIAGSHLYMDYLDYIVKQCNNMKPQMHNSTHEGSSTLKAIVFPVENPTFVDSIGYYHNLIIADIQSNGKSYINDNDSINYSACYKDVLEAAKNHGICCNSPFDTQILFKYLESIIKPMARMEASENPVFDSDKILSIFFNETYQSLNYGETKRAQQREICDKIILNYAKVSDDKLVEYGKKINDLIVNSNLDDTTKYDLKVANNIALNSSLLLIQE